MNLSIYRDKFINNLINLNSKYTITTYTNL